MVESIIYQEMSPEESNLDWRVTRRVLNDAVLMKTLDDVQAGGEKHAVIALVTRGEVTETYVSPEAAVIRQYPFNAVKQAFDFTTAGDGVCLLIIRDGKAVISINNA